MIGPEVAWRWRAAHLTVLWAFAFVQPLLDLLGNNADFFVARGNGAGDIVAFGVVLTVLPPLLLLAIEVLAGLFSRRLGLVVHLALVAALAAAFGLQLLDGVFDLGAGALVAGASLLGAVAAVAYARSDSIRSLLSYLSPAPAVFLALFLLFSDASEIVLPQDEVRALGAGAGGRSVVFVQLDELATSSLADGRGGIDRRRFPSFAALAEDATWYRNATTVADHTNDALPAILTGSRPDAGREPLASDYPENMFTLFAGEARLNVHEYTARLCPEAFCEPRSASFADRMRSLADDLSIVSAYLLLPAALTTGLPPVNEGFAGFAAGGGDDEDLPYVGIDQDAIEAFMAGIEREPRSLHYIHLSLPHVPWRYLPSGQDYGRGDIWREFDEDLEVWAEGETWVPRQAQRAHLLQAGYADLILGRIMKRLREAGAWEDALVVVLADHGVAFTPGASRRYTEPDNAGEVAPIPLFVKAPGQPRGRVDESPLTTIDVLPTIADLLGIEIPFELDGRPAAEVRRTRAVSVLRGDGGEPVELDLDLVLRGRDRAAARLIERFGTGWDGVWRMGPNSELIGRRVVSVPTLAGEGGFEQEDGERLDDVDPGAVSVPSLVTGALTGVDPGAALAVAVNDRIAAVGRAYESVSGGVRASLLVPPESFREGDNEVRLYEVTAGEGGRALVAL